MSDRFDRLKSEMEKRRLLIDAALDGLPAAGPARLAESVAYSLRAGGKRLRPLLCLAAGERCGASREEILPMALAHEMIHTASLIHDDLPCMDDDSLRRGKPTNHRVYGEALALLAGDALLAWAFEHAARGCAAAGALPERLIRALAIFAEAIGPSGICGGQVLDTDPGSQEEDPDFVRRIAETKTAALIRSAVLTGAVLGGAGQDLEQRYWDYGTHLGMAFQIVDDILDVTGTAADLGKTAGKDAQQGKRTFVSAYGLDRARALAGEESLRAAEALRPCLSGDDLLLLLPEYLAHRTR